MTTIQNNRQAPKLSLNKKTVARFVKTRGKNGIFADKTSTYSTCPTMHFSGSIDTLLDTLKLTGTL